MNNNPYKVQGTVQATMLGRGQVFETLVRHLTKETPDHVSVIGPKLVGKSMLLKSLADHFTTTDKSYIAARYWDMRHHTPGSDDDFKNRFAAEIRGALMPVLPALAKELETVNDNPLEITDIILRKLDSDSKKILIVMDDFDRILAGAKLSRNLWDSMRDIARHSSLRLVTGSQKRLRELCKTEESKTSDFWNIFYDTPVQVAAFRQDETGDLLKPFEERNIAFANTAQTALFACTGGVPVLVSSVLSRIYENMKDGFTVSGVIVDDLSRQMPDECHDLLSELWDDCPFELQNCLTDLSKGDIPRKEISSSTVQSLLNRGYITVSDNMVKHGCRIMKEFAQKKQLGIENLRLLFGDREEFEKNIKSVLELRLQQCNQFDEELYGFVTRAVSDVTPSPRVCLSGIRGIAERALDLILKKEIPDGSLPRNWVEGWKHEGETVYEEMQNYEIPRRRNGQCHLLRLMTGTLKSKPVAKYISKTTLLLIDFLQSVGDFGQHLEGNPVTVSFAASVCSAAIDLYESLQRELSWQA